ncbi:MAG: peptidoglycan-binding protein [Faecalibacterium prausnitzii]|jgi:peptidoglycan hydrolase-like protein with peptidoglycan-binding domain|nr:peptidoglycan-binding protein [Faecalibacterium prausnitzii]
MTTGILRIQAFAARKSAPVEGVRIAITGDGFAAVRHTDAQGNAEDVTIQTPACRLSLEEQNTTQRPYAVCSLTASKPGYRTVRIQGVQIFPGQVTLAQPEMIPETEAGRDVPDMPVVIPEHPLFAGQGGSGARPVVECPAAPLVLDRVVIPKTITVHLGKPSASARNVTVSFRDYIANVASSEVYPTWPEQALRANIHCQISLALNRIYTEWYPSKGYSFNITNSTSYDQYYVHGRTVFDVMVRLTNDIFNTYIRKKGTVNPYYAEYCDGKSVSCAGLKQWGTVTLANQGKNALQILRYYYGNDVEIVRSDNIRSIPQSYPGSPLRQGSSGPAVFTLQRQLNRIAKDYPFLGKLNVDGVFGAQMASTVRAFQKQFNLTADGVVGRQTWYKISYIYVSVKDLAELTSEGETAGGTLPDGSWGGTVLRQGSRGSAVERVQFWLNTIAQYDDNIPTLTVDGIFGTGTTAAVRAFQRRHGLTVDGVVGKTTWDAIYREYRSIQSDNGTPNAYPGTPLRPGDRGQNVRLVQFWLKIARSVYSALNDVGVDGIFGPSTTAAVKKFQSYFGLASDGIVGRATWSKLYEVYNDAANDLLAPNLRPGDYPGVLRVGSSGRAVRELQFYLYILSAYQSSIPAVSIDGRFGPSTEASVRAYQKFAGLTVDGIVGRATWDSLYKRASQLRQSGPVIVFERQPWPGAPLQEGSEGPSVLYYTVLLQRIGYYFDSVQSLPLSNRYTPETVVATRSLQALLNLPVTGIVDQETWAAAEALGLQLAAFTPSGDRNAALGSQYPGYALGEGSIGPEVEQIARWLNQRAAVYCGDPFVEQSPDFTAALAAAVKAAQGRAGLLETGTVGRMTWNALRQQSSPSGTLPPEGPGPVCPPCPCAEQKEG